MWTESRWEVTQKVTRNVQSEYLTEKNDHKIASRYTDQRDGLTHELVWITLGGEFILVDPSGRGGKYGPLEFSNNFEYLERGLDWLTWRYSPNLPYSHGPLSNFYVEKDGLTLEHRFAALKTNDLELKKNILSQKTAGKAKKLGRAVPLVPGWDDIKRDLMWDLLLKKFIANPYAARYLLATEDAIIQEKNTWGDKIWGVDHHNQGQNLLGHGLMYVREVLNGT
jgi:ribA/ribD-fused uncharacterized protein